MKTTKTATEQLQAYKRANKVARARIAAKQPGAPTADAYMKTLEQAAAKETKKGVKTSTTPVVKVTVSSKKAKTIPTIHIVDVLDSSGSMHGTKSIAANKGINQGVEDLLKEKNVNYTYTLCDFSDDIQFPFIKTDPKVVPTMNIPTRGSTALLDAIGDTIAKVGKNLKPEDKVLVNIYTDGQENASRRFNSTKISTLIKEYSQTGWTFTFIGTKHDVAYVNKLLNIDESNSLVYDGTGAGLDKALTVTRVARASYTASVQKGEDVSKGFYKNMNNIKN